MLQRFLRLLSPAGSHHPNNRPSVLNLLVVRALRGALAVPRARHVQEPGAWALGHWGCSLQNVDGLSVASAARGGA